MLTQRPLAWSGRDFTFLFLVVAFLGWSAAAIVPGSATGQTPPTFTVNSLADVPAAAPLDNGICETAGGNGICTLRAAIMKANHFPGGSVTINIPAGLYGLTIAPTGTDSETTGDLNVTNSMTIVGASAASTIIDANTIDRVLSIDAGATVTISNVTIRNGLVSDLGGGILNRGTLTLNDSVVAGNFTLGGSAGAGILNFQTLTLNRTSVRDNQASGGNGGGLFNGTSATMVLNSSTVSGNQTLNGSYGGGIVNDGTATLNGSLIANNRAAGKGGGIWNASGTLTLTNSTISNNSAFSDGGGVYNNATFSTYFATIAGNLADDTATGAAFGGGLFNASGAVSLKGTILSQNYSGASSVSDDCSGKIGALDYNLIESVPNGCFVQLLGSGNVTAVPSRLHSLRDNGGQTQTRALSAGSPAVDAVPLGNCTDPLGAPLTIDQRGIPRPVGGLCDMGAFEGSLATGLIGVNLIRNGDAEGSAGSPTGAGVGMPYWSGSAAIVPYGAPGGFPLVTDPGPANRGRNFFSGGVSAVAQISQVIDIEAIGAAVDAGQIRYDLSGYFGGFANQNDRADIVAFFYTTSDGSGVSFAHSGTIGDVLAADRGNQTGLLFRSTSGVVPGGARSIRVSLSIVNGGAAGTYNDGYADSLSLVLSPRIARPRDFNGDGTSDVLWRHGTGVVYTWFMNKTTVVAAGSPGSVGTDWTIAGVGDFNGDGKADILWRHTSGAVYIWLMDGTTVIGTGSPGAVGTDWTIAAVGDFNGDGNADILWRHSSGAVYIWLMNGTTVIGTGSPGAVGTDWTIAGVGDFNGDGKADILWRHSSGAVYIWLMDGTSIAGTGSPGSVSSDWTIQGVGDFNVDGMADILWRHSSGLVYVWLMNGTSVGGTGSPGSAGTDWSIREVGDFDGDGRTDILWRHTSGVVYLWLMNGTTIVGTGSPGSVDSSWAIQ